MCQFCENTCSKGIYFDIPNESKLLYAPGFGMECYLLEDSLVVVKDGDSMSKNIRFCPMCGRSLNERKRGCRKQREI